MTAKSIPVDALIAELKTRLVSAESERDAWRASGRQENYLAACSKVDALELRLDRLKEAARQPVASTDTRAGDELSIAFNGRKYAYRGYRYDRYADAVNYAHLDRSRAFADASGQDGAPLERALAPSETELELMRTLGIRFADGVFHWRDYRYDRLADAVAYARRGEAGETRL